MKNLQPKEYRGYKSSQFLKVTIMYIAVTNLWTKQKRLYLSTTYCPKTFLKNLTRPNRKNRSKHSQEMHTHQQKNNNNYPSLPFLRLRIHKTTPKEFK